MEIFSAVERWKIIIRLIRCIVPGTTFKSSNISLFVQIFQLYYFTYLKYRVQLPFKLKYWKTYWMIQQFCCRINIKIGQELLTLLLVLKYFLFIPPPSFPCWLYKYLSRIAHEVFIPFVNNFSNVFFFKYQNIYTRIRFILIEIVFSNSRILKISLIPEHWEYTSWSVISKANNFQKIILAGDLFIEIFRKRDFFYLSGARWKEDRWKIIRNNNRGTCPE